VGTNDRVIRRCLEEKKWIKEYWKENWADILKLNQMIKIGWETMKYYGDRNYWDEKRIQIEEEIKKESIVPKLEEIKV